MRLLSFLAAKLAAAPLKLSGSLVAGLLASPLVLLVRRYLFDDFEFLGYLLVAIMLDTGTALVRHWRLHNISSRRFSRLFPKVLIYLGLLILAHVMTSFKVHGQDNLLFQWFDSFLYSAMMGREALSVLENLAAIEPALVPAWLLRRLATFNELGPSSDLTNPLTSNPPAEGTPTT